MAGALRAVLGRVLGRAFGAARRRGSCSPATSTPGLTSLSEVKCKRPPQHAAVSWGTARPNAPRFLADPGAEIRRYAQAALDRIDRQRRTDEQRRQLPEPLRTKTERHQLKWVAIAAGQIVAVDPGPSWRRRHPQAQL